MNLIGIMWSWRLMGVMLMMLCCMEGVNGEGDFEWIGIFNVTSSSVNKYIFELKNSGEEDFDTFHALFFVTNTSTPDEEGLEAAEEVAELYFESAEENNSSTALSGSRVLLGINEVYEISYSNESWLTSVTIELPADGLYALFTNHHPEELCGTEDYDHCFRNQLGQVVPFLLEESHHDHDEHEEEHHDDERSTGDVWMYTLVGTGLCWLVVFSGLILIVCGTQKFTEFTNKYLHLLNIFASGAILSTVVFLIVIEAYHFLEATGLDEAELAAVFGVSLLGGFISPTIIELIVFRDGIESSDVISSHVVEMVEEVKNANQNEKRVAAVHTCDEADLTSFEDDNSNLDNAKPTEGGVTSPQNSVVQKEQTYVPKTKAPFKFDRIVIAVLCGDFLHNFCDGIFIGVAVQTCSLSLMWTIILVTMFHEFAQEVSDFVILTTKVGLTVPHALTYNAIGGLSVILGGIFINLLNLSDTLIGVFLAYGSGNLIYLSAAELFPLLHAPPQGKTRLTSMDKLRGLLCFCFGAFIIGLTLLRHEHCEAGGADGSDGHSH